MESISGFLNMGGYGGFVWPAFGLTALVMVSLLVSTLRQLAENRRQLARMEAAQPSHKRVRA